MNIIIKKATIKDLKQIQELSLLLFEKEKKDHDSLLRLDWTFGKRGTKFFNDLITKDKSCLFIAVVNNNVVGYIGGTIATKEHYRNVSRVASLENIFVIEKYRSKNIGSMLYDEFLNWCKTKKVTQLKVSAYFENKQAIKFYKKHNFKESAVTLELNL